MLELHKQSIMGVVMSDHEKRLLLACAAALTIGNVLLVLNSLSLEKTLREATATISRNQEDAASVLRMMFEQQDQQNATLKTSLETYRCINEILQGEGNATED